MTEFYGLNKIRAHARANRLNRSDAGWIVVEVEGGYGVRHDGVTCPPTASAAPVWCVEKVNTYRNRLALKAA